MNNLDVISLNIWQIIISLLNLVILFFLFRKFLFEPVKKVIAKRQEEVDSRYDSASKAEADAMELKSSWETRMKSVEDEAGAIIKEAVEKDPSKFEKGDGDQKTVVSDPLEIISQAIENMKPKVEVKTRRVGGTTYPVPVPINEVRQLSLALRWMTTFAAGRHGMGMPAAVAAEIVEAFQGQGNVIKKRDDVHKMAQANKAFAHYAW